MFPCVFYMSIRRCAVGQRHYWRTVEQLQRILLLKSNADDGDIGPALDSKGGSETAMELFSATDDAPVGPHWPGRRRLIGMMLAERVGFEPTVPFRPRRFSRPLP